MTTAFEAVGTTITLDSGAGVNLETDALSIGINGDTDVAVTFNANSADGVLTWKEDEAYFQLSDDILMGSTEKIQVGDLVTLKGMTKISEKPIGMVKRIWATKDIEILD